MTTCKGGIVPHFNVGLTLLCYPAVRRARTPGCTRNDGQEGEFVRKACKEGATALAEDRPSWDCTTYGAYCMDCILDCSLNGVRYFNYYEGICRIPAIDHLVIGTCSGYVRPGFGCQTYCA
jgi:hypothetical protein